MNKPHHHFTAMINGIRAALESTGAALPQSDVDLAGLIRDALSIVSPDDDDMAIAANRLESAFELVESNLRGGIDNACCQPRQRLVVVQEGAGVWVVADVPIDVLFVDYDTEDTGRETVEVWQGLDKDGRDQGYESALVQRSENEADAAWVNRLYDEFNPG